MSKFQQDLTRGSVAKQLFKFALPFLLSNLLQAMYNMADMLIVGQFSGPVGTSAVGIGGSVTILVINLISGLSVGGTVLIAQFIGAKAGRRQKDDWHNVYHIRYSRAGFNRGNADSEPADTQAA